METCVAGSVCFEAIGRAATNTAFIDLILMNTFRVVAGDTPDHAKAIFYGLDSVKSRREITRKLANANGHGAEVFSLLDELARVAKTANIARIELTHAYMRCSQESENPGLCLKDSRHLIQPIKDVYIEKHVCTTIESVRRATSLYERLCMLLDARPDLTF